MISTNSVNSYSASPIEPDTSVIIRTVHDADRSHRVILPRYMLVAACCQFGGLISAHRVFDEMLSPPFAFLLVPFLLLLPIATCNHHDPVATSSPSLSNGTNVYDLLTQYGLPPGLLPDTVTSFSFSEEDGEFEVNLSGPCYVEFDYLVYYEPKITGVVRYGIVSQLKGIQVQRFLLWLGVDAIKVDLPSSQYIYFDVGWITKKLNADQFMTIHSCRSNGLIDAVTNTTKSWFSV